MDGGEDAGPTGSDAADEPLADAGITPITLADEWVEGWYAGPYRGLNLYDQRSAIGYPDGYYTQWRGDPGVTLFANVSDCSGFSNVLMTRAYGWLPATTNVTDAGVPRPQAADYYWAIRGGDHFVAIDRVNDIAVGDVVTLLYGDPATAGGTGHVAWIDELPQPYSANGPVEPGLSAFAITIIDSSSSYHYASSSNAAHQDDRYLGPLADGGTCADPAQCTVLYGPFATCDTDQLIVGAQCAYTGVGRGQMRVYVDASGSIAAYTWGTSQTSTYYTRPVPLPQKGVGFSGRDIVVGRYTGN